MPDVAIAPPAAAPAAAPSAPSPAPAPAAPAAPAPPAAPAATPTPAPEGQSTHDRLLAGWQKAKQSVAEATGEEAPAEVPPAEVAPAEAAPAEPVTEAPTAEDAPPEEAAAEPVTEAAAEDATAFDDGAEWSADDMRAVEQRLAADPDKGRILSALRREADTREIRNFFPTKEAAAEAAKGFGLYQNLDNRFLGATTREGAAGFLNEWVKQAMITDDAGQPQVGADGQYQFHPALFNTLNHIFENRLGVMVEHAKTSGNGRLQAALDVIREEIDGPTSPAADDVPEELRPYAEAVKSREQKANEREEALNRQQREEQQARSQQAIERVELQVVDTLDTQLKPAIARAGLSQFEEGAAREKIGTLLEQRLNQHPTYNAVRESILSRPASEARDAALRKHDLTYMQEMLGPIAAQVIREAKGGARERQAARQTRVASQARDSRTEPRGVSVATPGSQATTPAQMRAQIVADYKAANNGAEPDSGFVRGEMFKRTTLPLRR